MELFNLSFFGISGWDIDLDYCDTEWFVLEMNRYHSVIFETASSYGTQKAGGCDSAQSAAKRSYPTSEVRGGGREKQPHIQGAVAARVQEGLEELFHIRGQEGRW